MNLFPLKLLIKWWNRTILFFSLQHRHILLITSMNSHGWDAWVVLASVFQGNSCHQESLFYSCVSVLTFLSLTVLWPARLCFVFSEQSVVMRSVPPSLPQRDPQTYPFSRTNSKLSAVLQRAVHHRVCLFCILNICTQENLPVSVSRCSVPN